jgi:D-alanyl-lipoteichoic acid acyltransferase DltB (MBOAT superfamily)
MFGLKKIGNKVSLAMIITFTISGLWHGANWNFALWGFLNGLFIAIFLTYFKAYRKVSFGNNHLIPTLKEFLMVGTTFNLIAFTLVLFRAPDIHAALGYYEQFFTHIFDRVQWGKIVFVLPMTAFVFFEWINRHKVHPLENLSYGTFGRWFIYFMMTICVVIEMGKPTQTFIYFQF